MAEHCPPISKRLFENLAGAANWQKNRPCGGLGGAERRPNPLELVFLSRSRTAGAGKRVDRNFSNSLYADNKLYARLCADAEQEKDDPHQSLFPLYQLIARNSGAGRTTFGLGVCAPPSRDTLSRLVVTPAS